MRLLSLLLLLLCAYLPFGCAQQKHPEQRGHATDKAFDSKVSRTIRFSVPTMDVAALKAQQGTVYILDAREREEYEVSHLPGARFIGYKDFGAAALQGIPKDARVVLYCSIGYRSEKIGEQLLAMGYKDVHNLFGSLFEWANRGYPLIDKDGQPTTRVHTYNRSWSRWVIRPGVEKVW